MIIVCGEALVDLVPGGDGALLPRPGGSPANVAVTLGRLGVPVALVARLSTDGFGELLRTHLSGSGVSLEYAQTVAEPTTLAVVTLDGHGDAQYSFYVDGCADGGWSRDELPPTLPAGPALHVSGALALARPEMADAVEALLRRADRVVTLDPNPRPALARDLDALRERLWRWLPLAHLVKVSDDDLAWLAPGSSIADVAEQWRALGPSAVVVTRGRDGVYAQTATGELALPPPPVTLVDTVGAGDAFMGGLLAALLPAGLLTPPALSTVEIEPLRAALDHAQRVAAVTCSRVGADPPWRRELESGGPALP